MSKTNQFIRITTQINTGEMKNSRVVIIGCGNIGISILQGLLKAQTLPSEYDSGGYSDRV